MIFQGRGMTERNVQQAHEAREELRRVVGFSAADEIEKLDRLKKAGSTSCAKEGIAIVVASVGHYARQYSPIQHRKPPATA
jgi:hypothetical protein